MCVAAAVLKGRQPAEFHRWGAKTNQTDSRKYLTLVWRVNILKTLSMFLITLLEITFTADCNENWL